MKKIKISKVWILVAIVVVLAVVAFLLSGNKKKEQVQFNTAEVAPANIVNTVTATGTIEPVTSVTVGTQVSGIVSKLYVDYQAANFRRNKTLYQKGLISGNDYESARLSYQTAMASVSSARDQVSAAREQVKKAQTNLGYATITSPIDGIVLSKSVEEGQTVAASFSTPTLFTIAKDLTNMQVVADVDEADIGDVKVGERVTFTVDAYPDNTFSGTVKQVRQEATTTNNVVTYSVVISAPNADLKLKPGLTATVTIYTQENKGVLSVPSKALRFTPEKETVGGMKIKDIANAKNKVWTIEGNTVVAHRVNIGMTDGSHTQILSGISRGAKVITGISSATPDDDSSDDAASSGESSPFAPKGPGSKKK